MRFVLDLISLDGSDLNSFTMLTRSP